MVGNMLCLKEFERKILCVEFTEIHCNLEMEKNNI